jgi:hypothetical protein
VLATRHDLRLGLHRLRLEGELAEIRAGDLRFSLAEAAELFAAAGLELPGSAVAVLHERTEGWAAGLRLAALAAAGHPDPERFAAGFSGAERTVAEYLLAEHTVDRRLIGQHPRQHGVAAVRLGPQGGKRRTDRLAQAAADTDLVQLRRGLALLPSHSGAGSALDRSSRLTRIMNSAMIRISARTPAETRKPPENPVASAWW